MALLYAQQGDRRQALPLAQEAARLWSQMGHAAYAQRAQQLVAQLERQGWLTMQFHPSGTRIAGRYEVAGRPLIGGMGIVYLCFDHQEQRPVALKTFKPGVFPDRAMGHTTNARRAQQIRSTTRKPRRLTMQVHPSGTRIAGRYEVAGRPLVGGMGIVYLCFDHQEQRPVALKTFKPEFLPDRAARERFLEEGNTWVRLGKHPHIVRPTPCERIGDGRRSTWCWSWWRRRKAGATPRCVPG